MFVLPNKNRTRLVDAAMGRIACDTSFENAKLVNVIPARSTKRRSTSSTV